MIEVTWHRPAGTVAVVVSATGPVSTVSYRLVGELPHMEVAAARSQTVEALVAASAAGVRISPSQIDGQGGARPRRDLSGRA